MPPHPRLRAESLGITWMVPALRLRIAVAGSGIILKVTRSADRALLLPSNPQSAPVQYESRAPTTQSWKGPVPTGRVTAKSPCGFRGIIAASTQFTQERCIGFISVMRLWCVRQRRLSFHHALRPSSRKTRGVIFDLSRLKITSLAVSSLPL